MYDVIIIGGGYAGIIAARQLHEAGKNFILLESRNRLGGRIYTKELGDGNYVDLGGQWIGPTQEKMYALLKEYGIDTFPTYDEGQSLLKLNGKLKSYKGVIPPLPLYALLSLDRAIKKINRLSKKISLQQPWLSENANYWDSLTLQGWIEQQMGSRNARKIFKIGAETVFAADPSEISLLHALFYIKSGRDFDTLINIRNGAQQDRIKGGAQLLVNRMAEAFSSAIRLNSAVTSIEQTDDHVIVKGNGFSLSGRKVIIAVPPVLAGRIHYNRPLPALRDQLLQRVFMGSVIKCYAIYDEPFWRTEGLNGLCASDSGYISVTFDNSPADGKQGVLMGFSVGSQAKALQELPPEKRKQEVLNIFGSFIGARALHPNVYLDHNWAEEEWSRGCFAGIMPAGAWTTVGKVIRTPCGHIHWAGTETSDVWNGYMEGAVRSGERAAAEVMSV